MRPIKPRRDYSSSLNRLRDAFAVDNLEARQYSYAVDIHLLRPADHVIKTVKSDLENVVLRIVGHSQQRQPFRLDLAAEGKRRDLDLGALADKPLRHPIEEGAPFRFFELSYSHRSSPMLGDMRQRPWILVLASLLHPR